MKLRTVPLVCFGLFASAATATALPFADWSLTASGGKYYLPDETPYEWCYDSLFNPYFAGLVQIDGESASLNSKQFNIPYLPVTAPDGTELIFEANGFTVGLEHEFALHRGDIVSGWAKISTEDLPGYSDHAQVSVNGSYVWYQDLNSTWRDIGDYDGPWQRWEFVAPTTGIYAIGVSVYGDDLLDTVASFRDFSIQARVPDSSATSSMLALGLLSLGYLRRRLRR